MIKTLTERRPSLRRRSLGTLGDTQTVTIQPAGTAANPEQVMATGLPAPYSGPTMFMSRAVAEQIIASLNQQIQTNNAAGVTLFQAPLPNIASMSDAELCPLMSQGCITQAQAPDRVYGCFLYNQAHPETRGSGICSDPRYNPNAVTYGTTPTLAPTWNPTPYPGYETTPPAGTAPTYPTDYTPYVAPTTTSAPATSTTTNTPYNPTQTQQTPVTPASTTPTTSTTTTTVTTPAPTGGTGPTPDPTDGNGLEVVGNPNGKFPDGIWQQIISALPPSLQELLNRFRASAAGIPVWLWAIVAAAILFWIESKRKGRR